MECVDIENIPHEIELNGESLLLQRAEARVDQTEDFETCEFLIDAVGRDCNQILKLRFYATASTKSVLEGKYDVIESIVFTPQHITSLTYTIKTIEPLDFEKSYGIGGEIDITVHQEREYSLDANVELSDGNQLTMKLRYDFM